MAVSGWQNVGTRSSCSPRETRRYFVLLLLILSALSLLVACGGRFDSVGFDRIPIPNPNQCLNVRDREITHGFRTVTPYIRQSSPTQQLQFLRAYLVDRLPAVDNLDLQIEDIAARFKEFSESVKAALSIEQVGEFLEANGQALSGSDDILLRRCQDLLFYGPLEKCPVCHGNNLEFTGSYCACAACIYRSKYPPRKRGPIKYPISIVKQINPRFNPDWDPPYVEGQGFFARFWSDVLRPYNPREAARVEITLNMFLDGMREINGWRMNNRTFWIYVYVVVFVLTCFFIFVVKLWSNLSIE